MESVDQKDEQYLGYQFNGGDLKDTPSNARTFFIHSL